MLNIEFNSNQTLKCHKFILNARNPYVWSNSFLKDLSSINLNEIDFSKACYKELLEYLKICSDLKINDCENCLIPLIRKENCIEIYDNAVTFQTLHLKSFSHKIISNYWEDFSHLDFIDTTAPILYDLIKSHCTYVLHTAIKLRREDVVLLFMVESDSKIPQILNQLDPTTGDLPLDLALKTGQYDLAYTLVKYKADLDAFDKMGVPLLHKALLRMDQKSCDFLLDSGADANARNNYTRQNCLHLLANLQELYGKNLKSSPSNDRTTILSSNNKGKDYQPVGLPFQENILDNNNLLNGETDTLEDEFYITIGNGSSHNITNNLHSQGDSTDEGPPNNVIINGLLDEMDDDSTQFIGPIQHNASPNVYSSIPNLNVQNLTRKLIKLKIDVNAIDYDGKTPLQVAIENGSVDIFDIVLVEETSSELNNFRDKNGHNLLWTALTHPLNLQDSREPSNCNFVDCGGTKSIIFYMARKLIDKNINYADIMNTINGLPLINELLTQGYLDAVKFLIELPGINLNCRDNKGMRPIHIVAASGNYLDIALSLFNYTTITTAIETQEDAHRSDGGPPTSGFLIDVTDTDDEPKGDTIYRSNSSHQALDLNATTSDTGQTALHIAIREENWPFVDALIERFAYNVEMRTLANKTAGKFAALNLNIRDFNDETPLSLALSTQNYDLATKLIFNGANMHGKMKDGKTLLERCIENSDENQAIFLLENGATLHDGHHSNHQFIRTTDCSHLLELAIRKGLVGVVKALCQLGIDLNCQLPAATSSMLIPPDATFDLLNLSEKESSSVSVTCQNNEKDKDLSLEIVEKSDLICPLWLALKLGKQDIASILVQYGCDTTFWSEGPDGCLQTLLHKAIDENRQDIACFLIRSNCEINCVRKPVAVKKDSEEIRDSGIFLLDNQTPLHMACAWGFENLISVLLEHKADVNVKDSELKTPLHIAIENERPVIVKALLNHPFINLTAKDRAGRTPFETAMNLKNHEAAQMIVDREPSACEQVDNKGNNFLHTSIRKQDIENVLFLLGIRVNVNSRVQDFLQNTPLHLAASESTEIIVRNLILAGSDLNAINTNSQTPLHLAIIKDNTDFVRILIENGADYDLLDNNGNNALQLAIINGNIDCTEYLLAETHIPCDLTDNKGRTPLHLIGIHVKDNGVTILDLFKQYRPQMSPHVINLQDFEGNTPLLYAYLNGRGNLCRSLVKVGSSLGLANHDGISVFNAPVASHQLLFRLLDMLTEEPTWTESDSCNECNIKFGITMRKHHCRHCGRILCTKCSDKTLPIPKFNLLKPVRVCSVCYDILTSHT